MGHAFREGYQVGSGDGRERLDRADET